MPQEADTIILGFGVVDAHGQLRRRETAEHHRVHGPQPGAGEHGDERLGDHRHVDHHPVALGHALGGQSARETGHFVAQLGVGERLQGLGDRAVVDHGRLAAAPAVHVQVEGVVAGVHLTAGEPPVKRLARVVQDFVPFFVPVAIFGDLSPEAGGVLDRSAVGGIVRVSHGGNILSGVASVSADKGLPLLYNEALDPAHQVE